MILTEPILGWIKICLLQDIDDLKPAPQTGQAQGKPGRWFSLCLFRADSDVKTLLQSLHVNFPAVEWISKCFFKRVDLVNEL